MTCFFHHLAPQIARKAMVIVIKMIAANNRWSTPIATKMNVAESKKQPFSAAINLLALSNVMIGSGDGNKYQKLDVA